MTSQPIRRSLALLMAASALAAGTIVASDVAEASNHRTTTINDCSVPRPTLRLGTQNQTGCIKALQDFLNVHKFLRGDPTVISVDGVFGRQTHEAVRQFQYWSMLVDPYGGRIDKVDGVVGPDTWLEIGLTCVDWYINVGRLCSRVVRY